eukprot:m.11565 g.11565  ORF g.11565 m.11565 type:complete len:578 (+) comp5819_c0_seq2:45-1778(+)
MEAFSADLAHFAAVIVDLGLKAPLTVANAAVHAKQQRESQDTLEFAVEIATSGEWWPILANAVRKTHALLSLKVCTGQREGAIELIEALHANNTVATLGMCGSLLTVDDARAMATMLARNNSLTTLNLSHNSFGAEGGMVLAAGLPLTDKLRHLDLTSTKLGPDGSVAIAKALRGKSLSYLGLGNNQLGVAGFEAVSALIAASPVEHLNVMCEPLDVPSASALAAALATAPALSNLDLSQCELSLAAIAAFSAALPDTRLLSRLCLRGIDLGPRGALPLAAALKQNTSIQSLDLSGCCLGNEGVASIAGAFNCTLTELNLSMNMISFDGAAALAKALKGRVGLQDLTLCGNNQLQSKSVARLCKALKSPDSSLLSLRMSRCDIGASGVLALAELLAANPPLTLLDIHNNRATDESLVAFVSALATNTSLTTLNYSCVEHGWRMQHNDVTIALLDALKTNTALTEIWASSGSICPALVTALAEMVAHNHTLTRLTLEYSLTMVCSIKPIADALETNTTLTHLSIPPAWRGQEAVDDPESHTRAEALLARNRTYGMADTKPARGIALEGDAETKRFRFD